jgi:hypothetical protein
MDEAQFKSLFMVTFLATVCANAYPDACSRGLHSQLENHPAEDAADLAESAWQRTKEFLP